MLTRAGGGGGDLGGGWGIVKRLSSTPCISTIYLLLILFGHLANTWLLINFKRG